MQFARHVEAYDVPSFGGHCAACMPASDPFPSVFDSMYSPEIEYQHPFQAGFSALFLRGEVLLEAGAEHITQARQAFEKLGSIDSLQSLTQRNLPNCIDVDVQPDIFHSVTNRKRVTFQDDVVILCYDSPCKACAISHCSLDQVQKALDWNLQALSDVEDPLSFQAVSISSEDFHFSNPLNFNCKLSDPPQESRIVPTASGADPADHLRRDDRIPLPPFVETLLNLPGVTVLDPQVLLDHGILIRTWYLHHRHFPRWRVPRFVELSHEVQRWTPDIRTSWRDMIQQDEPVFLHTVVPDPPRHYLGRDVFADVIVSQFDDETHLSGLLTVPRHEPAGILQTFAIATSLPPQIAGVDLAHSADLEDVCQNFQCSFFFQWAEIGFHRPATHHMRPGHGFAVYIRDLPAEHLDDAHALVQFPAKCQASHHSAPLSFNEGDDQPAWYPFSERGGHDVDVWEPTQATEPDRLPSSGSSASDDAPSDPDEDLASNDDAERQSALMYHLNDQPVHALIFWTDYERLMSEIAWHFHIPRQDLFEAYELAVRPKDIPAGTAPLVIHFVNDFPHGTNMALILLDVEIHANVGQRNHQLHPDVRRRVLIVPGSLTREGLLDCANVFEYCRIERSRCLVEYNHNPWPLQMTLPIDATHGDYAKIIIPPPRSCNVATDAMLLDSQELSVEDFWSQYFEPSSSSEESEAAASSPEVSPSLIASEDIKREFGPARNDTHQDDDELSQLQLETSEDQVSFMQQELASSSAGLAQSTVSDVSTSALLCPLDFNPALDICGRFGIDVFALPLVTRL
eukprot:s10_g8.t1